MAKSDDYIGREQSQVKHYILQHYLERFAHIIGSWCDTITYVDCFSGPWESSNSDLSDTSFAIALTELRKARETLSRRKRSLDIRCLFLEEQVKRHAKLKKYAQQQTDVRIETRNATMLDALPEISDFINAGGRNSFPFIFIDPTGWTGFDLDRIAPLLQQRPGEVLINFMTEHIRRFVTPKVTRAEIIDSFRRLFGTDDVFDRISQITDAQDREDELFTTYAGRVRAAGGFAYTCPSVVLHPVGERTYFHLIYATRHRKGVEEFKEVEKAAYPVQERLRAAAEERETIKKTKQPSLFAAEVDQPPSPRAMTLRRRYLAAARQRIVEVCGKRKQVPFDEIWDTAMAFPLVWDSDVKEWIAEWQKAKRVKLLNLKPKQQAPPWEEGHVIEFLK
jgi:three-Cys-motif partner protein